MFKRIGLLILTNILVIVTIGIVLSVLGVGSYIGADGTIDFVSLLIFSAVVGFVGAFFSLAISRIMAKWMMRVRVLDPNGNLSQVEQSVVEKVHRLSRTAGLTHMPQVGIYESGEVNAFATGPTKKRSLVAVSSGLLQHMDEDAVEGIIAHEVAHVANGDMVTMTLLQGIVNTFVVFFARIVAFTVSRFVKEEVQGLVHFIAVIFFEIVFSILGSFVVMAYSRRREYAADKGGADLAGRDKMIHALQSLKNYKHHVDNSQLSLQTLKINSKSTWFKLLSSHPDLDDRIESLKYI